MCVEWVNEWEVAQENIIAYKVVRRNGKRYESPTLVSHRAYQGDLDRGSVLEYRVGKKIKSDEPGIYCISSPMLLVGDDMALLEVVIPKGTAFRRGRAGVPDDKGKTLEMRTLNAREIKVVKVYRGKVDKRFNWPVLGSTVQYVWNYVTATSTTTSVYLYLT